VDHQDQSTLSAQGDASARILRIDNLSSPLAGPFDFELSGGHCLAITGPSGSGKSLLLRMIADLDPNMGEVWLGDLRRSACPASAWRRQVTYVAAEAGWWGDTVVEHFEAARLEAARVLARRLELKAELLDGLVSRLSTGEKQRLALIRALVHEPAALLLDEPTSSLDQRSVQLTEALLREHLDAGLVLILVSHDPQQASRMGDQRAEMRQGRLAPL
jgi:putative ABC transport system ATP-binding protein